MMNVNLEFDQDTSNADIAILYIDMLTFVSVMKMCASMHMFVFFSMYFPLIRLCVCEFMFAHVFVIYMFHAFASLSSDLCVFMCSCSSFLACP